MPEMLQAITIRELWKLAKSGKELPWFVKKPTTEYPTDRQVFTIEEYDRAERKYAIGRRDDISYGTLMSGDKVVYIGFTY